MERNVGGLDRQARLVVGPLLVVAGIVVGLELLDLGLGSTAVVALGAVLVVIGAVLVGSGVAQKCPVNAVLGINTCERTA